MIKDTIDLGIAGEFAITVRRADGSIKQELPFQKNLITDQYFNTVMSLPATNSEGQTVQPDNIRGPASYCVVGTSNNEPTKTDTALGNYVATNKDYRNLTREKTEPVEPHLNHVKLTYTCTYIFDGINNQNITEVGLVSNQSGTIGQDTHAYVLTTHALIKGPDGRSLTVTVLEGEVLEVTYRLNMYVPITKKTGVFSVTTTGESGEQTQNYDYFIVPTQISKEGVASKLYIDQTSSTYVHIYGVKEADSELSASYDLNSEQWQAVKYNGGNTIGNVTVNGTYLHITNNYDGYKFSNSYISITQTKNVFDAARGVGEKEASYKAGIYAANFEHGIRAYSFGVSAHHPYELMTVMVAVKNQANGQGIKKTDKQLWEFGVGVRIKRWGE